MSMCTVVNTSSIYCDNGCCGTVEDRKCCDYELSEEIIIVICVVGAVFVIAVVIALICCLTSKNKDQVTPIGNTQRRVQNDHPRPRRPIYPRPPPYSEAPPTYEAIETTPVDLRNSPSSTDPILPGTVENHRNNNRRINVDQNRRQMRNIVRGCNVNAMDTPSDAPPSYASIVNSQVTRYSNEPSTSRVTPLHSSPIINIRMLNDDRDRSSPHPSLASENISIIAENDRGQHRLHRTYSGRSDFITPLPCVGGATLRVVGSETPVTIREITVHSQFIQNSARTRGQHANNQESSLIPKATRIPRPIQRIRNGNFDIVDNSTRKSPAKVRNIKAPSRGIELGETSRNNRDDITPRPARHVRPVHSVSNSQVETANVSTDTPSHVVHTNAKRHRRRNNNNADDIVTSEEFSTDLKPTMAARREQRRAILVKLRERKENSALIIEDKT
ncbi:hypothetical protein ACF0H5_013448 [Mactra antiquata]